MRPVKRIVGRPRASTQARIGLALVGIAVLVAVVGPLIAPHPPDQPMDLPGAPPSGAALLGTDVLGRDVLSRLLHGGLTVLMLATSATALALAGGIVIGLTAGYRGGWLDSVLMRSIDVLLAFPALVVALLLVGGLGKSPAVLVIGAAIVQWPSVSRVTRAATLEVRSQEYVDAAIGRGESVSSIVFREVLPNIAAVLLSSVGLVFGWCVIMIASMNFLGLGLLPPAADWGLMVAENQQYLGTNPWAVLAPAGMLAVLTVGINLIADAYSRRSSSVPAGARLPSRGAAITPIPSRPDPQ